MMITLSIPIFEKHPGKRAQEQSSQSQTKEKTESCFKCHSFLAVNYYMDR